MDALFSRMYESDAEGSGESLSNEHRPLPEAALMGVCKHAIGFCTRTSIHCSYSLAANL